MKDTLALDLEGLTATQIADLVTQVRSMREGNTADRPVVDDESWRDAPSTGWTREHVELMRTALAERGRPTQLAAFDMAIEHGGTVTRAQVYALGGYAEDRKLNNWTAPFKSVVADLVAHHGLPEDADLPMVTNYPAGTGYQSALGFSVAPEIVRLMRT